MSKEKEDKKVENPFGQFDLLDLNKKTSPFGDSLEMEFIDEADPNSIKSVKKDDNKEGNEVEETPASTEKDKKETKVTQKKEDKKEAPKKEEPVKKEEKKKEEDKKTEIEASDEVNEIEEQEEEAEEVNPLQAFASFLDEKGVVKLEDGKPVESEDDLVNVIQNEIKSGIEGYKNSMPEDAQKFFEFIEAGGDPKMFHKLYYEQRSWKDVDPTKEANHEAIVREALERSNWDPEDIDAEIQDKKDLGKLATLAEKFHKKLVAGEEEDKKSLVEAQKEYQRRQQEHAKKEWDTFKDNLYKQEELNGFKLTPKLKDELWSFMTKTDRKTGKTPLQLHNETNTNAQFLYAYLAMNNWDMSKLEKSIKTKVTSELASKLKNASDNRSKISRGQTDSFKDKKGAEGKNAFSAFKTAIENNYI